MLLLFDLFYFLLIYFYTSIPKNSLQMICNLPKWWAFLTYDGFKSHVNVTEGIKKIVEKSIRVGKEEARTRTSNQAYDKF